MKQLLLSMVVFCSTASFAQDTTQVTDANAVVRKLNGSFTSITITDGIDLYLTQGNTESVWVGAADEKYMDRFKTEVENNTLKIYYDNKGINYAFNEKRKLKAWVSFKTLEKLVASGGADVRAYRGIDVASLDMKFTSGSHFNGKITAKELRVEQNSGSGMTVSGKADKINVEGSSGSIFKGYELTVDYCTAKSSSGAGVHITINKELNAKANSGGGIRYKGTALIRDVNISSGGIVKKEK